MRRGRVILYLVLIVILLFVGGFVIWNNYLKPADVEQAEVIATAVPDTVDVVIITQNAPRGTLINESILGTIPYPREFVFQGMFTDKAAVVGRQAKFDLDSGVILTASMLVDNAAQLSDAGSLDALSIPANYVAISIPIDKLSSVSYVLKPGDQVMVIASMEFVDYDTEFQTILPNASALVYAPTTQSIETEEESSFLDLLVAQVAGGGDIPMGRTEIDPTLDEPFYIIPAERQRPRLATQIIIPNARVLRVGEYPWKEEEEAELGLGLGPTPTPLPDEQVNQGQGGAPESMELKPPDVVTLIVTPQEAVNITYLLQSGVEITLALRSTGDDSLIDTSTVTMQYFLDDYSIPLPAKLPYGFYDRIDNVELLPDEVEPTPIP
jgi:Flp pilus assembly protein CpaB